MKVWSVYRNIAICAVAAIIALLSSVQALSSFTSKKQADFSLSLPFFTTGWAAEAKSAVQVREYAAENRGQFPAQIDSKTAALAAQSFYHEPNAAEAVAIMALSAPPNNQRILMQNAYQISRREPTILAWLINDSEKRQNVKDLLQYYDISIRTISSASELILPVMANALSNPDSIGIFSKILSNQPPWSRQFWQLASSNAAAVKNAAVLRTRLYDIREDQKNYADTQLIATLVNNYYFENAIQLYSLLKNGIGTNISGKKPNENTVRNSDFSESSLYPPLDWQIFSDADYGASIADNSLYISAINDSGGLFARQLINLEAKPYQLDIAILQQAGAEDNLTLQLSCAEKIDRKPANINLKLTGKKISQRLDNSAALCRYYWLNINGRSFDVGDGMDAVIESISIR